MVVVTRRPMDGLAMIHAAMERSTTPQEALMVARAKAEAGRWQTVQSRSGGVNGLGMIEGAPDWLVPSVIGLVVGGAVAYFAFKK